MPKELVLMDISKLQMMLLNTPRRKFSNLSANKPLYLLGFQQQVDKMVLLMLLEIQEGMLLNSIQKKVIGT
jgi:hypothetical protein